MSKSLLALLFALTTIATAIAAETIDRIVATVNRHPILQSDWDDAVRFEAFMNGRPVDNITLAERKIALDHLIDQELLREQIRASESQRVVSEEAVAKRIAEIRAQYASRDESSWRALLVSYQLSESELRHRVADQLNLIRLVDDRLRPTIQIDSKSIESYYQQSLLPQLRQSGAKQVPLPEVFPQIKELLTQQRLNQLLATWLQNLRASGEIHGEGSPQGSDR